MRRPPVVGFAGRRHHGKDTAMRQRRILEALGHDRGRRLDEGTPLDLGEKVRNRFDAAFGA